MNREEALKATRQQTAAMLSAYHESVNVLLTELVELIPSRQREPYRSIVQRFTVKVLALLSSWSRP